MTEHKPPLNVSPDDVSPGIMTRVISWLMEYQKADIAKKLEAFRILNKIAQKGGIVFAGDSITEGYPLFELFPRTLPLYNRGIGGITSVELLENLNVHILDLKPKKLFLLIGTNDLGKGASVEDTAETIKKICMKVIYTYTETKIYLISVLPVDNSREAGRTIQGPQTRTNEAIRRLNQILQKYVAGTAGLKFLDIHSLLVNNEGNIQEAYSTDGIHLSIEGYQLATNFLMPFLTNEN
jgi:lysophospholipase L1-like esterase